MAPKYTLHYFQIPGRGEFIRVIVNQAGVEFENKTYPLRDLPKIKADGKNSRYIVHRGVFRTPPNIKGGAFSECS